MVQPQKPNITMESLFFWTFFWTFKKSSKSIFAHCNPTLVEFKDVFAPLKFVLRMLRRVLSTPFAMLPRLLCYHSCYVTIVTMLPVVLTITLPDGAGW